jgi:hypothetical protein
MYILVCEDPIASHLKLERLPGSAICDENVRVHVSRDFEHVLTISCFMAAMDSEL